MASVRDTRAMLSGMAPRLGDETWVFCTTNDPVRIAAVAPAALATFREAEGLSLILQEGEARRHGFDTSLPMRCITLAVHSALDGVGLTAAVAEMLADEDIPCNVVAAYHHDHIFVPEHLSQKAAARLEALSRDVAETADG